MKSYVTEGTGSQQTLRNSQDNKIPIYDSLADVTADLANLSVGQIVATKDTGDELAQPVDVVEEGNLHAVSSNAVAEELKKYSPIFKTKRITGTLTANGYISTNIAVTDRFVVGAICEDNNGYAVTPVKLNDKWAFIVYGVQNNNVLSPRTGTVALYYFYYDLI